MQILDEAQVKWSAAILVSLELGNCRVRRFRGVKPDDSRTTRSTTGLILYLSLLDFADGSEQLNQVLVASRPRKLNSG